MIESKNLINTSLPLVKISFGNILVKSNISTLQEVKNVFFEILSKAPLEESKDKDPFDKNEYHPGYVC